MKQLLVTHQAAAWYMTSMLQAAAMPVMKAYMAVCASSPSRHYHDAHHLQF